MVIRDDHAFDVDRPRRLALLRRQHHLRSSIHPYIFAAVYYVSNLVSGYLSISPLYRANLLLAAPKLTQALFAAVGDFYTWKLAGKVYGNSSYEAWGALALTVLSPWQWFCSTRTLSNCLETSLTVVALYLWPWGWPSELSYPQRASSRNDSTRNKPATQRPTIKEFMTFSYEVIFSGSLVLGISTLLDRVYYGVLNLMDYFRTQYVGHYLGDTPPKLGYPAGLSSFSSSPSSSVMPTVMTIGFLMPCHSTPWRSHLIFPRIHAWALSCEPPVNLNSTEKSTYLDEADLFYEDPATFLQKNMQGGLRHFPSKPSYQLNSNQLTHHRPSSNTSQDPTMPHHHLWPDYLAFFAQLEPTLRTSLHSSPYAECYRTWNTAWHDDWRRKGDIVVWCLDQTIQREWREHTQLLNQAGWQRHMQQRERQFDKIIDGFRKEAARGSSFFGTLSGVRGSLGLVSSFLPASWSWSSSSSSSSYLPTTWPFSLSPPTSRKWYQVSWSWSWPSLSALQRNARRWQLTWSWPWSWVGRRKHTRWPEWMTESPWVPDWDALVKKSKSRGKSERMLWS
ncbi:mannosyltransferase [Histoplasma capsulatum H143]|uniref:Mannosyltransferase n=1 Tax=Ajellomyces capsulatus (strain H143) TaxID=544712 RepID=C6H8E5_AJECH|nr:mannosyltransferase [Histoplasma capsulatum H143]